MKRSCSAVLIVLLVSFLFAKPAAAVSVGDAALVVSISTVSGAILGASTLPFYSESGKHTKNIFYGAALGAVAGVFIAAYSGVKEGTGDDDEASAKRRARDQEFALSRQLVPEQSTTIGRSAENTRGAPLVWAPLAEVRF